MIFKPYHRFATGCASYLFGCGSRGVCAVVDPHEADVEDYIAFASSKAMTITHVFETHVHADHRSGGPELVRRTGATYAMHESAEVSFEIHRLRDGDRVELGNTLVDVLHTPGHTPESVSYVVTDLRRGDAPWFVLTGDTLFVGSVGRPDLPGDAARRAEELYRSLHDKLLRLPDDVEVYPAHFAGSACGAGMSGKPSTTIGFERRFNPMLALDRSAFVAMAGDVPPKPDDMVRCLADNRGEARPAG